MSRQHLVRVGALGHVGRFTSVDAVAYPRHSRVVLRTGRGLELGEVLGPADEPKWERGRHAPSVPASDGSILRGVTVEDDLLLARLDRNRQEAITACGELLAERNLSAALMDVEQLFDGQTLVFYFLGEMIPDLETLTTELADLYEVHVQFRRFADAVTTGCGPDCGTESAAGCTSCAAGCAVAGACGKKE